MSGPANGAPSDFAAFEARLHGSKWTVLLQSPRSAWFARYGAAGWETAPPDVVKAADVGLPDREANKWPDHVFEARAFNGTHEVRWVRRREGGVLVDIELPDAKGQDRYSHLEPIRGQRLLWGTVATKQPQDRQGWTIMESKRIGRYAVPLEVVAGPRAAFRVLEILTTDDHGNVSVADELCAGLEAANG